MPRECARECSNTPPRGPSSRNHALAVQPVSVSQRPGRNNHGRSRVVAVSWALARVKLHDCCIAPRPAQRREGVCTAATFGLQQPATPRNRPWEQLAPVSERSDYSDHAPCGRVPLGRHRRDGSSSGGKRSLRVARRRLAKCARVACVRTAASDGLCAGTREGECERRDV